VNTPAPKPCEGVDASRLVDGELDAAHSLQIEQHMRHARIVPKNWKAFRPETPVSTTRRTWAHAGPCQGAGAGGDLARSRDTGGTPAAPASVCSNSATVAVGALAYCVPCGKLFLVIGPMSIVHLLAMRSSPARPLASGRSLHRRCDLRSTYRQTLVQRQDRFSPARGRSGAGICWKAAASIISAVASPRAGLEAASHVINLFVRPASPDATATTVGYRIPRRLQYQNCDLAV
jgi:hypothetical protein